MGSLLNRAASSSGFIWGSLEDWFSGNAPVGWLWWAHTDDLNLGRTQPPAAFQMSVM